MEPIYIVMIAVGGVFVLLFFIYLVRAVGTAKANKRKQQELDKAYSDINLAKMEYSDATCNEETNKILNRRASGQLTFDDLIASEKTLSSDYQKSDEAIFNKIGKEGVEEITGNFKG